MDDRVLEHVRQLAQQGREVPLRPNNEQYYGSTPTRLRVGPYAAWRSRALVALRGMLPEGHVYLVQFEQLTASTGPVPNDPEVGHRDAGVGVLEALIADLDSGLLTGLRDLVSGEVFSDFLAMSRHLHEEGYVHAAASVAGAVLEDALRRSLAERGHRALGNLESMNQIALNASVYGPLDYQQVKVWIGIRNLADHGEWDRVDPVQVGTMLMGIGHFLAEILRLPAPRSGS